MTADDFESADPKYENTTINAYVLEGISYVEARGPELKAYDIAKEAIEKQAVLSIRTGNTSFNSFAAEVIYHAVWTLESENMIETYTELGNNPYLPTNGSYLLMANIIKETIFDSGVKADMGVSEENESGTTDYDYYNYNGKYVREQREIWGDF